MCSTTESVMVYIPSDLSHTREARWTYKPVDSCIAPIVRALILAGIYTRSSCCGHGADGSIVLQDGRELVIKSTNR